MKRGPLLLFLIFLFFAPLCAHASDREEMRAIIETGFGIIELGFFPGEAPVHVRNFLKLAREGFYDGTAFHRIERGSIILGGDPYTRYADPSVYGSGGPGYTIKAEFNKRQHRRGILSMERRQHPDSAGSLFFICLKDLPGLNGKFTVFGEVLSGMDVVDEIAKQPLDKQKHPRSRIEMDIDVLHAGPADDDLKKSHSLMKDFQRLLRKRQYGDALPIGEEIRKIREKALGAGHPLCARIITTLAVIRLELGESEKAREDIQQALEAYERNPGLSHPKAERNLGRISRTLKRLAGASAGKENFKTASELREMDLELLKRLRGPAHWSTREAAWFLEEIRYRAGLSADARRRFNEAGALLRRSEEARNEKRLDESLAKAEQSLRIYREMTGEKSIPFGNALYQSALTNRALKNHAVAARLFLESASIYGRLYGEDSPAYAALMDHAGREYMAINDHREAERHLLRALEIRERVLGEEDLNTAHSRFNLGFFYFLSLKDSIRASSYLRKAASQYRILSGTGSTQSINASEWLDSVLVSLFDQAEKEKNPEEAVRLKREIVNNRKKAGFSAYLINEEEANLAYLEQVLKLPGDKRQILEEAEEMLKKARSLRREGKGREALAAISASLAATKDVLGENHRKYAERLNELGNVYSELEEYDLAERSYMRALDIIGGLPKIHQAIEITTSENLAELFLSRGRPDEADRLLRKITPMINEIYGKGDDRYGVLKRLAGRYTWLANLYSGAGKFDEALKAREAELAQKTIAYGKEDWQTVDASLNLDLAKRMANLTPAQHRRIAEAEKLVERGKELRRDKRYAEALDALRKAEKIRETLLGKESWSYFHVQTEIISTHFSAGENKKALYLASERLRRLSDTIGTEHPQYGIGLVELALLYSNMEDYGKSSDYLRQAAGLYRKIRGEKDGEYIYTVKLLTEKLALSGQKSLREERWDSARKSFREAAAEGARVFGKDFWMIRDLELYDAFAQRLSGLGQDALRRIAEARNLFEQAYKLGKDGKAGKTIVILRKALALQEEIAGTDNPDYLSMQVSFISALVDAGELDEAEKITDRTLTQLEKLRMVNHPYYIVTLYKKSTVLSRKNRQGEADDVHRRASDMFDQIADVSRFRDETWYLDALRDRALYYEQANRYEKAIAVYRNLLSIARERYGIYSRPYARELFHLGRANYEAGQYSFARHFLDEARRIQEAHSDIDRKHLAETLNLLSLLHYTLKDYSRSEDLARRAITLAKEAGEEHTVFYSSLLLNLALTYSSTGNLSRAEPLLTECVRIRESRLGPGHLRTAAAKANLGFLYLRKGELDKAEASLNQALNIQSRSEKKGDRLAQANTLIYLADVMERKGTVEKAEDLCRKAVDIQRTELGSDHPTYASGLSRLAGLYLVRGKYKQAEETLREALRLNHRHLEEASAALSESSQLTLTQAYQNNLFAYLSASRHLGISARDSYQYVLSWKGVVFTRQLWMKTLRGRPEYRQLSEQLQDVTNRLSTLTLSSAGGDEKTDRIIRELTERKEHLESEFARATARFQEASHPIRKSPRDIQALLPEKTALLDIIEYWHTAAPDRTTGAVREEQRIAGFMLRRDRNPVWIDLGPARPIAEAIENWRKRYSRDGMSTASGDPGTFLREKIWEPVLPHLDGVQRVLVSPDGTLTRIPFSALPGTRPSSYLVEEMSIAVIPVPQLLPELLRKKEEGPHAGKPSILLVGDVDFDSPPGTIRSSKKEDIVQPRTKGRSGSGVQFPALPGTTGEIRILRGIFEKAFGTAATASHLTTLRGRNATERALRKNAGGQKYIHLATHGFFAPEGLRSATGSPSAEERSIKLVVKSPAAADEGAEGTSGMHPGLLSGIALVGANHSSSSAHEGGQLADDGILTALEVAELDLADTELVVLSACETGLGKLAGGEGVFGLQRAFQVSGARTVVASLWTVDDAATQALMTEFYRNLWERKMGKLEALRQAQLSLLRSASPRGSRSGPDWSSPYYWAAFTLSGDWR